MINVVLKLVEILIYLKKHSKQSNTMVYH